MMHCIFVDACRINRHIISLCSYMLIAWINVLKIKSQVLKLTAAPLPACFTSYLHHVLQIFLLFCSLLISLRVHDMSSLGTVRFSHPPPHGTLQSSIIYYLDTWAATTHLPNKSAFSFCANMWPRSIDVCSQRHQVAHQCFSSSVCI